MNTNQLLVSLRIVLLLILITNLSACSDMGGFAYNTIGISRHARFYHPYGYPESRHHSWLCHTPAYRHYYAGHASNYQLARLRAIRHCLHWNHSFCQVGATSCYYIN